MSEYQIGIFLNSTLYVDLLTRIIRMYQDVDVIGLPMKDSNLGSEKGLPATNPDVIILPMYDRPNHTIEWAQQAFPRAKLLIFGEKGNHGYRHMPDKTHWEELRPFGLQELLREVRIG